MVTNGRAKPTLVDFRTMSGKTSLAAALILPNTGSERNVMEIGRAMADGRLTSFPIRTFAL